LERKNNRDFAKLLPAKMPQTMEDIYERCFEREFDDSAAQIAAAKKPGVR
jgi:hypothetical protein